VLAAQGEILRKYATNMRASDLAGDCCAVANGSAARFGDRGRNSKHQSRCLRFVLLPVKGKFGSSENIVPMPAASSPSPPPLKMGAIDIGMKSEKAERRREI
jgi:hypothetical protein